MLILGFIVQIAVLFLAFQIILIPLCVFSSFRFIQLQRWAALAAVSIAMTLTVTLEILRPKADLNPIVNAQTVIGHWKSDQRQLQLLANSYTITSGDTAFEGKWRLEDEKLYLSKENTPDEYLRVIKYGDEYRLLIDAADSAETYIYSHSFTKQ